MKVLICGSRDFSNISIIREIIRKLPIKTEIIHGGARGADWIAEFVATEFGFKTTIYLADWKKYGKSAGMIRNRSMLIQKKPDIVYAFFSSKNRSKGTSNMCEIARKKGIEVVEFFA